MTDRIMTGGGAPAGFDLEDLFDEARRNPPQMPADLSARLLADALAEQARIGPPEPRRSRRGTGWAARLSQAIGLIGGMPALGGLAAATVAGIWIGTSPPAALAQALTLDSLAFGAEADPYLVEAGSAYDFAMLEAEN